MEYRNPAKVRRRKPGTQMELEKQTSAIAMEGVGDGGTLTKEEDFLMPLAC